MMLALAALFVVSMAGPARHLRVPVRDAASDTLPTAAREVLQAIAVLPTADTVPNKYSVAWCKGLSPEKLAGEVGPWCRSVLRGRQPPGTTLWFVASRDDLAGVLARLSGRRTTVQPFSTVTCPSSERRSGPGIGHHARMQLRWNTADSVHVDLQLSCAEPEENQRRLGTGGAYYFRQEYIVTRRGARWVAVAGETVVT